MKKTYEMYISDISKNELTRGGIVLGLNNTKSKTFPHKVKIEIEEPEEKKLYAYRNNFYGTVIFHTEECTRSVQGYHRAPKYDIDFKQLHNKEE